MRVSGTNAERGQTLSVDKRGRGRSLRQRRVVQAGRCPVQLSRHLSPVCYPPLRLSLLPSMPLTPTLRLIFPLPHRRDDGRRLLLRRAGGSVPLIRPVALSGNGTTGRSHCRRLCHLSTVHPQITWHRRFCRPPLLLRPPSTVSRHRLHFHAHTRHLHPRPLPHRHHRSRCFPLSHHNHRLSSPLLSTCFLLQPLRSHSLSLFPSSPFHLPSPEPGAGEDARDHEPLQ